MIELPSFIDDLRVADAYGTLFHVGDPCVRCGAQWGSVGRCSGIEMEIGIGGGKNILVIYARPRHTITEIEDAINRFLRILCD